MDNDSFYIGYYMEPLSYHPRGKANTKRYFVVYGETSRIANVCKEVGGVYYDLIKSPHKTTLIRGGWRILVSKFGDFIDTLHKNKEYVIKTKL